MNIIRKQYSQQYLIAAMAAYERHYLYGKEFAGNIFAASDAGEDDLYYDLAVFVVFAVFDTVFSNSLA